MRFTIFAVAALIGFTSGAAITKRYDIYPGNDGNNGNNGSDGSDGGNDGGNDGNDGNDGNNGGAAGANVCGPLSTPLCCQTDILGLANLNCGNAGPVTSIDNFNAVCAETGLTAQCCIVPLGTNSLLCTAA